MPAHWTYASAEPTSGLEQGDILQPTAELRRIFKEIHPHFGANKYLGFLVATQSCDLVKRKAGPKASYVNVVAIRPLSQVVHKLLGNVSTPVAPGIFKRSDKAEAKRLLERLLNQNEQALGLFFLQDDAEAGIAEPAVAFLRVSVALKSEHYDVLLAARVGRLTAEFRAKLGWLIGNLYVRPATRDWADDSAGQARFVQLVNQWISEAQWLDDELVDAALSKGVDLSSASADALEALRPPSKLDRALQEVETELLRVLPSAGDPEQGAPDFVKKLRNRLRSNGKFTKLLAT